MGKGAFAIVDDHAWLMEGTEDGITLSINEKGISCKLSKYLPQYIAKNMKGYVDGLLEEQTKYSWSVLNDYGNMLSPSVMFVLELILNEHKEELNKGNDGFSQGLAFSFSPGVGAEGILLKVL